MACSMGGSCSLTDSFYWPGSHVSWFTILSKLTMQVGKKWQNFAPQQGDTKPIENIYIYNSICKKQLLNCCARDGTAIALPMRLFVEQHMDACANATGRNILTSFDF